MILTNDHKEMTEVQMVATRSRIKTVGDTLLSNSALAC